ncbi:MAG TPA: dihydrolipoamide acetyltransferase family protein, partial [Tepidiformaceae bacterium]
LAAVTGTGVGGCITRADVEHAAVRRAPTPPPREPATPRLLVSPRAQRLARERGIDISTIPGSGPGGAITGADVEKASAPGVKATSPQPVDAAPRSQAQVAKRGPIVQLMERSNREVPHYYLGTDIDMSGALAWLAAENAKRPVTERILYAALLLKATAMAVHDVPEVNGYWIDGAFQPSGAVNLGAAISIRSGGLVAPAIADAGNKPLDQLMHELTDLVQRARAGRLRASEMTTGTITVTNLGEQGVSYVFGVIYPPQVALVGFGRITERPWAANGMIGARPIITATLAGDHRASDGHRGGRFLAAISRLLQKPEHL